MFTIQLAVSAILSASAAALQLRAEPSALKLEDLATNCEEALEYIKFFDRRNEYAAKIGPDDLPIWLEIVKYIINVDVCTECWNTSPLDSHTRVVNYINFLGNVVKHDMPYRVKELFAKKGFSKTFNQENEKLKVTAKNLRSGFTSKGALEEASDNAVSFVLEDPYGKSLHDEVMAQLQVTLQDKPAHTLSEELRIKQSLGRSTALREALQLVLLQRFTAAFPEMLLKALSRVEIPKVEAKLQAALINTQGDVSTALKGKVTSKDARDYKYTELDKKSDHSYAKALLIVSELAYLNQSATIGLSPALFCVTQIGKRFLKVIEDLQKAFAPPGKKAA